MRELIITVDPSGTLVHLFCGEPSGKVASLTLIVGEEILEGVFHCVTLFKMCVATLTVSPRWFVTVMSEQHVLPPSSTVATR